MSALRGIRLCEDPNHRHDASCRQPCEICEVLYPPRDLVDLICAACWREHDAMVRAYDEECGADEARQAEYQRKMSALLAGR